MKIEEALKKIGEKLAQTGTIRASLFNLIVVVPDNPRREYVKKITDNVIERFPCRVIFITLTNALKEIKIDVTATSGAEGIACDTIEISTPISLLHKIPFLILPHFLPDLPIYLLWTDHPAAYPTFLAELQKWCTRTIFDSEVADNLSDFCKTLLLQKKDVSDLNWARTENWRELLAATFYSPARLSSLQTATDVEILYNNYETPIFCHTEIQARYIEAWLSSCLHWSPTIKRIPHENKELAPGTVISIDIRCKDQFHYSFSRDPAFPHQVRTIICDEDKCDIPSRFIFSKAQSGLSLVNMIYHSDLSPHFLKALHVLEGASQ